LDALAAFGDVLCLHFYRPISMCFDIAATVGDIAPIIDGKTLES